MYYEFDGVGDQSFIANSTTEEFNNGNDEFSSNNNNNDNKYSNRDESDGNFKSINEAVSASGTYATSEEMHGKSENVYCFLTQEDGKCDEDKSNPNSLFSTMKKSDALISTSLCTKAKPDIEHVINHYILFLQHNGILNCYKLHQAPLFFPLKSPSITDKHISDNVNGNEDTNIKNSDSVISSPIISDTNFSGSFSPYSLTSGIQMTHVWSLQTYPLTNNTTNNAHAGLPNDISDSVEDHKTHNVHTTHKKVNIPIEEMFSNNNETVGNGKTNELLSEVFSAILDEAEHAVMLSGLTGLPLFYINMPKLDKGRAIEDHFGDKTSQNKKMEKNRISYHGEREELIGLDALKRDWTSTDDGDVFDTCFTKGEGEGYPNNFFSAFTNEVPNPNVDASFFNAGNTGKRPSRFLTENTMGTHLQNTNPYYDSEQQQQHSSNLYQKQQRISHQQGHPSAQAWRLRTRTTDTYEDGTSQICEPWLGHHADDMRELVLRSSAYQNNIPICGCRGGDPLPPSFSLPNECFSQGYQSRGGYDGLPMRSWGGGDIMNYHGSIRDSPRGGGIPSGNFCDYHNQGHNYEYFELFPNNNPLQRGKGADDAETVDRSEEDWNIRKVRREGTCPSRDSVIRQTLHLTNMLGRERDNLDASVRKDNNQGSFNGVSDRDILLNFTTVPIKTVVNYFEIQLGTGKVVYSTVPGVNSFLNDNGHCNNNSGGIGEGGGGKKGMEGIEKDGREGKDFVLAVTRTTTFYRSVVRRTFDEDEETNEEEWNIYRDREASDEREYSGGKSTQSRGSSSSTNECRHHKCDNNSHELPMEALIVKSHVDVGLVYWTVANDNLNPSGPLGGKKRVYRSCKPIPRTERNRDMIDDLLLDVPCFSPKRTARGGYSSSANIFSESQMVTMHKNSNSNEDEKRNLNKKSACDYLCYNNNNNNSYKTLCFSAINATGMSHYGAASSLANDENENNFVIYFINTSQMITTKSTIVDSSDIAITKNYKPKNVSEKESDAQFLKQHGKRIRTVKRFASVLSWKDYNVGHNTVHGGHDISWKRTKYNDEWYNKNWHSYHLSKLSQEKNSLVPFMGGRSSCEPKKLIGGEMRVLPVFYDNYQGTNNSNNNNNWDGHSGESSLTQNAISPVTCAKELTDIWDLAPLTAQTKGQEEGDVQDGFLVPQFRGNSSYTESNFTINNRLLTLFNVIAIVGFGGTSTVVLVETKSYPKSLFAVKIIYLNSGKLHADGVFDTETEFVRYTTSHLEIRETSTHQQSVDTLHSLFSTAKSFARETTRLKTFGPEKSLFLPKPTTMNDKKNNKVIDNNRNKNVDDGASVFLSDNTNTSSFSDDIITLTNERRNQTNKNNCKMDKNGSLPVGSYENATLNYHINTNDNSKNSDFRALVAMLAAMQEFKYYTSISMNISTVMDSKDAWIEVMSPQLQATLEQSPQVELEDLLECNKNVNNKNKGNNFHRGVKNKKNVQGPDETPPLVMMIQLDFYPRTLASYLDLSSAAYQYVLDLYSSYVYEEEQLNDEMEEQKERNDLMMLSNNPSEPISINKNTNTAVLLLQKKKEAIDENNNNNKLNASIDSIAGNDSELCKETREDNIFESTPHHRHLPYLSLSRIKEEICEAFERVYSVNNRISIQLLKTLLKLHQQHHVLHLDLKSTNVFVFKVPIMADEDFFHLSDAAIARSILSSTGHEGREYRVSCDTRSSGGACGCAAGQFLQNYSNDWAGRFVAKMMEDLLVTTSENENEDERDDDEMRIHDKNETSQASKEKVEMQKKQKKTCDYLQSLEQQHASKNAKKDEDGNKNREKSENNNQTSYENMCLVPYRRPLNIRTGMGNFVNSLQIYDRQTLKLLQRQILLLQTASSLDPLFNYRHTVNGVDRFIQSYLFPHATTLMLTAKSSFLRAKKIRQKFSETHDLPCSTSTSARNISDILTNILVSKMILGREVRLKIGDFGIAKRQSCSMSSARVTTVNNNINQLDNNNNENQGIHHVAMGPGNVDVDADVVLTPLGAAFTDVSMIPQRSCIVREGNGGRGVFGAVDNRGSAMEGTPLYGSPEQMGSFCVCQLCSGDRERSAETQRYRMKGNVYRENEYSESNRDAYYKTFKMLWEKLPEKDKILISKARHRNARHEKSSEKIVEVEASTLFAGQEHENESSSAYSPRVIGTRDASHSSLSTPWVTTKSDVYSSGLMLIELFSRPRTAFEQYELLQYLRENDANDIILKASGMEKKLRQSGEKDEEETIINNSESEKKRNEKMKCPDVAMGEIPAKNFHSSLPEKSFQMSQNVKNTLILLAGLFPVHFALALSMIRRCPYERPESSDALLVLERLGEEKKLLF